MAIDLDKTFSDRFAELDEYLQLLEAIEAEAQNGPPRLGETGPQITTRQQRILYSNVFVQLYNLVESTIATCLNAVTQSAVIATPRQIGDLTDLVRKEWVRYTARTTIESNADKRLTAAFEMCQHIVAALPVPAFKIEKGAGNWDDDEIEAIAQRMGCELKFQAATKRGVKQQIRDDLGPLALVRKLRNDLAHGKISFVECSETLTAKELRDIVSKAAAYLKEVVAAFAEYIEKHLYLTPDKRPAVAAV